MASKFDMKQVQQFLLQKGERIGLYVAGGLGVLLLVIGLKGAFGKGPGANADDLKKLSDGKLSMIRTSTPSDSEKDEIRKIDPKITASVNFDKVDPGRYAEAMAFFWPPPGTDTKRRAPKILVPVETRTAVAHVQARAYKLSENREQITVVMGGGGKATPGMGGTLGNRFRGGMGMGGFPGGFPGGERGSGSSRPPMSGPPGGMGGPGGERGSGMGGMGPLRPPGGPGDLMSQLGSSNPKATIRQMKVEDLDSHPEATPAEDIMPLRMAIVVGSFPWKDQLEEYRKALHYDSVPELLNSADAPQFAGFAIERAEVRPGEAELHFQEVDLQKTFVVPVALALADPRWEEEDPELQPLIAPNLVMKRPASFRKEQYPKVETSLKHIEEALTQLKKAAQGTVPKFVNRFKKGQVDIFGGEDPGAAGGNPGGEGIPGGGPGTGKMQPGGGPGSGRAGGGGPALEGPAGAGGSSFAADAPIPDYILLRFLDVTIVPGKAYKYRFRVKVANPNFGQKNVVWPSLAKQKELQSDWAVVPDVVKVPPELYYYAVDMKALAKTKEEQKEFWNAANPSTNQVVTQIHRWLEAYVPDNKRLSWYYTVGDWVIAERAMLTRGEYLGVTVLVEVPIWNIVDDRFALVPSSNRRSKKVPVFFGAGQENDSRESILVDFTGGTGLNYNRYEGMDEDKGQPRYKLVRDSAPVEMLLMTPDGNVTVRNAEADADDEARKERFDAWKAHLDEIKSGNQQPAKSGKGGNPFGPNP